MSYDILIGNAELESEWGGEDGPIAEWIVRRIELPDAPAFPYDFNQRANLRSPGYSQWDEFCRMSGLHPLFYGAPGEQRSMGGGILSEHPGIVPLTDAMLADVKVAVSRWLVTHPGAAPGFDHHPVWHPKDQADDGVRGRDGILARLLWLEWWMTWALVNCERPAVYNR